MVPEQVHSSFILALYIPNLLLSFTVFLLSFFLPLPSFLFFADVIGVGDWTSIKSRRRFFENHAFQTGCDPLNPHYWYSQNFTRMMSLKVLNYISLLTTNSNLSFLSLFFLLCRALQKLVRSIALVCAKRYLICFQTLV